MMGEEGDTPRRIGRYEIRRVLGQGSMGAVYAAWDPNLRREVAIKQVAEKVRAQSKGLARFEREAQAIAAIRHPNVVQVFDYFGVDDDMFLVMEKLDGADLFEVMQRQGAVPEVIAVAIGHELCLALEAAHSAGILHRDLKPENVFLTGTGRIVLTDFGIVKAISMQAPIEGYREKTEVIGTPGFMAPEHMRGRGLGPSLDLFALGALLYNIATLHMPYPGSSPRAVYQAATLGDMRDPLTYAPTLSAEFVAILNHCLTRDPRRRPQSAASLRLALQGVLEDLGVVDLRQDLADYVADATALSLRAQQREAQALVLAIKVAKQDADTLALARLARRLKLIAPDHAILDLLADNASLAPSKTFAELLLTNVELLLPGRAGRGRGAPPWRRLPQLALVATLVLLCGFALGHHAALSDAASSGRPLSRLTLPLPPEQPAPPVTAPPLSAQMEVEVVTMPGDAAVVTIDGYVVAGDEVHQEALNPGRHLLEVRAPHVRFRRYIAVSAGERLRLVADCVHRLLMVR